MPRTAGGDTVRQSGTCPAWSRAGKGKALQNDYHSLTALASTQAVTSGLEGSEREKDRKRPG